MSTLEKRLAKLLKFWDKMPAAVPRRPLSDMGYLESDRDYLGNNSEVAVFLLDNIDDIRGFLTEYLKERRVER